jgi:hypothetical protein
MLRMGGSVKIMQDQKHIEDIQCRKYLVDVADRGEWVPLVQDMKRVISGKALHLTADLAPEMA